MWHLLNTLLISIFCPFHPSSLTQSLSLSVFKVCQVVGHSHGLITEGQQHGDERERVVYGTIPLDPPPLVACQTLAEIQICHTKSC